MPRKSRTPEAMIAVLLAFLVAGGIAAGTANRGRGNAAVAGAQSAAAEVAPIARRVEVIRGLRFKQVPKPLIVTPEQTRRDQLADLKSKSSAEELRVAARVLELLGL